MKLVIISLCFLALASAEKYHINKFMRPTGLERFHNVLKAVEYAKVVGGVESVPHSHPYQVGLFLTVPGGTAFCGGSLISRTYVMTAAHCVFDGSTTVSRWTVVLGAHNIYDEANSVRIQSTEAIVHQAWNPNTLKNDIALIKLPTPAPLNDNIKIVDLPPYHSIGNAFNGVAATVTGWGKSSDSSTQISEVLREVTVPIISNLVCNSRYLGIIQSGHLCTDGANGKGSCNGDSGGPLTIPYEGRVTQVGIVSFGSSAGCESGWPPVYTRVTEYLWWLAVYDIDIRP